MDKVPHWQWLMLLYFLFVAIPVMWVHSKIKQRILENKTALNLLLYITAVTATAFVMHIIAMYLYFKFIFGYTP